MTTDTRKFRSTFSKFLLTFALLLTVLAVFVPLAPQMPSAGLDTSWMFAMNQGVARGFVFGKDIIFTFGPYACIYTQLYDPATDRLMVCGSLFLGLSYALLLLLVTSDQKRYGLFLYAIFLACLMDSRDALLFTYNGGPRIHGNHRRLFIERAVHFGLSAVLQRKFTNLSAVQAALADDTVEVFRRVQK